MDYNDNDYEGQNLHLAGEETSKISSVLRPFALPKFDFDDSLHGHLRFDSLVDNEVFLGIPSQEDNQWIEDFSRGGNGIEFSSSAAKSCALPRHINVWSEATSSESVEMLLKAVGQEEMIPGENMVEESDPGDQLGSSTREMENSLRQDYKVDDVDYGDPSLPPAEVEGDVSRLNQSAGVEDVHTEHIIQVQETNFSAYGVCVDSKEGSLSANSGNSNADMMRTLDNQGGTCDLVVESLPDLVQENLPVLGVEIDNIECLSQNVAVSIRESVVQDGFGDASFLSPSCVAKGIFDSVQEQKERCNNNDDSLGETTAETDNAERRSSHEGRSGIESFKEEHAIPIAVTNFEEASMPGKGDSVSTVDGCNEVAFVVEPAGGSQQETVIFSSDADIQHQSEGCCILHEKLSKEDNDGLETEHIDIFASAVCSNSEKEQVPVIQPLDHHISCVHEDVCHGSYSSLTPANATFGSSMLHAVVANLSEKDGESNNADGPGPSNSTSSTVAGESHREESVIDDMKDAGHTAAIQENIYDKDHVPLTLISGSTETCTENISSMQAEAHESELDVSANENEENKLPLDSSNIFCDDNEKEVGCTLIGEEVKAETTRSEPNSAFSSYSVLNTEVEVANLSSCVEGDELVDCHEHKQPSCDTQNRDQSEENETEAPTSTSPLKEFLESNEFTSDTETCKATPLPLFAAAGEKKTSDQSISLEETSSVVMPDEASKELSKEMEHSANDLIVQDDGAEAAPIGDPMEVATESNCGKESSTVSVTSCTVEIDNSKQIAVPGPSGAELSQNGINNEVSQERNNVENVGEVLITSEIPEVNILSKGEGSFTFDVMPLGGLTGDSTKGLQSYPRIKACKMSLTGEESSTSGSSQTDSIIVKEITQVGSSTPGVTSVVCPLSGSPRVPSERKPRRSSSKSGKGSANKGNQTKETTPLKQTEKWDNSPQFFSPLGASQIMTFETIGKSRGPVSIPTSSLPDLNSSAPSSAFFQQPFTDLQQVQLRAQIFVYGSLIQGAAPDEAHMVSAFDGGRSIWEPSWRACAERLHGQKMQGNNTETPVSSRPGAKAPDHSNRQSEILTSMVGRASDKTIPSPVVNPMMSLQSPLWSMSTPSSEVLPSSSMSRSAVVDYKAVSPVNPYQTPPLRNYIAQTNWATQAPFPVPWLPSSQSSLDATTTYPAFPITEPVKLTSVKESLPITPGAKHIPPIPTNRTGDATVFGGAPSHSLKKGKVSTGQTVDRKTRKRKKSSGAEEAVEISVSASLPDTVSKVPSSSSNKGPAVEDISQISFIARNQADPMPKPVVSSHYSTSVAVTTPFSFVPKGTTNQFFPVASQSFSSDHLKRGDFSVDKRAQLIEGFSKVEEAKLEAQEAAAHAATAVSHCEGFWSQLDQHRNSGLTSEAESKLASAAVAMAAAASVAKAAAAAAKIASSAAVQAKQMADEALTERGTINPPTYDTVLISNSVNVANGSPVSILKGGDRNSSPNFAITAAREAARKRIEAASAATRHAENLDAIVKAAELVAEAVSHAGKIVSMSDPFTLSELAEAGLNNYWKVSQVATVPGSKPSDSSKKKSPTSNAGGVPNVYMNQHEGPDKDMRVTSDVVPPIQIELSRTMVDDHVTVEEDLVASTKHEDSSFKLQKDKKVSETTRTAGVVSDPDIESGSNLFSIADIKEGSYVEVLKDRGDLRKAWFSASVLSLRDGEALVCYTELQSDEGSDQLKEWISLEAKDGEDPKVRIPHPMTAIRFATTKKRRHAAFKDYTWSVGDRVDAWVQDCWCEGIIAEKNTKDSTTLSVNFPAQGETLSVRVWHLRPTLIWNDDQWVECARPRHDSTNQGDSPLEKRPKLESTSIDTKGKAKMAKNNDFVDIGRNEEPRLPLSATEKVFSIGSTREENKPNIFRTMRSGLQKEGSRIVFGVPKPGKKRKFMDVSKHYVSDRSTKTNVPNDSVKSAKSLMPQGSGSRGLKNNSRPDLKEKQVVESRPRALKSDKPPIGPSRTVAARKDESTSSRPNARGDAAVSTSNDENESGEENLPESGSFHNVKKTSGGPIVFSSQALAQQNRKKAATRNIASQRLNQGRLAPASGRLPTNEPNENVDAEVAEPRRSNRRIQPTSRLLEGLQSSLVISKIPSSSHDKSNRSQQNKGTNRGNNSRG